MNKHLITIFFSVFIFSVNAAPLTIASFSDDYVWQDRFKRTMVDAKKGIADSQYKIGEMYEKGRGTQKDMQQALIWFHKAAEQYHLKSRYKLGYLHYHGTGVPVDKTKAYTYLKIPAQNGDVRAQYYLGHLYADGQGVEKDPDKALFWYKRSSMGGYYLAEKLLAEHYSPVRKILQGKWMKGKTKPAEFLPSITTQCKKQVNSVVECLSGELKSNIATLGITYITKALLFDFQESGNFKVSYRNKIINVKKSKEKENKNAVAITTIKLGWQEIEHKLECSVIDANTINCVKNKIQNIKFNRYIDTPSQLTEKLEHLELVHQLELN